MAIRNYFERATSFCRNLAEKKDEEKIPFANHSTKKNNGAILQTFLATKNGQIVAETAVDTSMSNYQTVEKRSLLVKEDKGPMSKSRKACFLLSFNIWIIYFAAFIWFIPCRFSDCPGTKNWDTTFSNMELTTQLEAIGNSVIIMGYKNTSAKNLVENQGMLLALNSINGDVIWTKTLNFVPLQIHCGQGATDEFAICTTIDETKIMVFNSSNGDQLWEQVFISDFANKEKLNVLICGSSHVPVWIDRNFQIDTLSHQYKILNLDVSAKSVGLKFIDFPTDCDELFLKIKSINMNDFNESSVVFVCTHSQNTSLWTISNRFLCSQNTEENGAIGEKFHHLYSINKALLVENVLIVDAEKYGFIVSWTNAIVLVSKGTSYLEIWRHSFKNSSTVLSIIPGQFTSTKGDQIAVATQEENRRIVIHILNIPDGTMVSSMSVEDHTMKSILLILGKKSSVTDQLLVEMGTSNVTMSLKSYKSWEISDVVVKDDFHENSIFHTINFENKALVSRLITASSLKSKVIIKEGEDVDLILAERKFGSDVEISDYILRSSKQSGCS